MAGQSYSNGMGSGSVILGQSHLYKLGQSNNMSQRHTYVLWASDPNIGPGPRIGSGPPILGQGPQYWVRAPNIGSRPPYWVRAPQYWVRSPNIGSGPSILGQDPQYWVRALNIGPGPPILGQGPHIGSGLMTRSQVWGQGP